MPRRVERDKWILYKHTSDYELIKAVALDVKNSCKTNINDTERHRMQERLTALDLYNTRNSKDKPLDSINHRINTLEYFMFGYEDPSMDKKRFIFSPLGNLFMSHINDKDKLTKIFITMLFALQFQHPASGTPSSFQLYPFRLIFKLLSDARLDFKLYNAEYVYILAFVKNVNEAKYNELVNEILSFRSKDSNEIIALVKNDEHTSVNCVYEWQYYTQKLLSTIGIIDVHVGDILCKLFHPSKTNSKSNPTGRTLRDGYVEISPSVCSFIQSMLLSYSCFDEPFRLDDPERLQVDIIKEIYSFYPQLLLDEIDEVVDEFQVKLLELPALIEKYSNNKDNETAYLFEDVLAEGFNMFFNVEAQQVGGSGHTDIECLYIPKKKKFAVEAKSTANKLIGINAGRLREHREQIGGEYTIVITSRYAPAAKRDIYGNPIVVILASTFSEYLYNHAFHDIRDIDFEDFHKIIIENMGSDISNLISNMTMDKFATSGIS